MTDLGTLSVAAVTIGFFHCVCGPDHYVPFVAMSRVGVWSLRKTLLVTILCGVGHVVGSALLGFVGIALGLIVFQLEAAENARGTIAGWLFVAFGLTYFVWGVIHAVRCRRAQRQETKPAQADKEMLDATASALTPSWVSGIPSAEQREDATANSRPGRLAPWLLFTLFLFGPCEPLIPLMMYPAVQADVWSVIWVTVLFGLTTLITMTALVGLIYVGTLAVRFPWASTYGHALAGLVLLACGLAVTSRL